MIFRRSWSKTLEVFGDFIPLQSLVITVKISVFKFKIHGNNILIFQDYPNIISINKYRLK